MDLDSFTAHSAAPNGEVPRADERTSPLAHVDRGGHADRLATELTSARARAAFLAEASRLLTESLDYERVLQRVADAAVPALADWCAVDVVHLHASGDWPPAVRRIAIAGRDPAKLAWARKLGARVEHDWGSPTGLPHVLRTGAPAFFPEITDDLIRRADLPEHEKAAFLRIGLRSAICVPLVARRRTFGAISFAMAESRRRYDPADLALAEDLGRRAAVAIDHARLYADEREARRAAERAAWRLERLQSITAALSSTRTPAQVGAALVAHAIDSLGAAAAAVYAASESGTALELVHAAGDSARSLDTPRVVSLRANIPVSAAVRRRGAVFIASPEEWRAWLGHGSSGDRGRGEAVAALPLIADGGAIGAILLHFAPGTALGLEERTLLGALAHQCAQALDRARLHVAETGARDAIAVAQRRQATFLEAIADAFVTIDREWRYVYVNHVAGALVGLPAADLEGRVVWDVHPDQRDSVLAEALRETMEKRVVSTGEVFADPVGQWIEYRAFPSDEGLALVVRDIGERRRHDERLQFLAGASTLLASSLDYETTLANVAKLAVPALGSSCVIDLVGSDGQLERVATVFESEEMTRLVAEMRRRHPIGADTRHPAHRVLATGETMFYPEITPEMLPELVDDRSDSLALAWRLNPTSCVFVALRARGRTLGVMSLCTVGRRRRFDERDRALVEDLAQRVALAVDNARLHDAERRARAEAEAANQAKSDFLAIMSHELRTPLTAVVGYTELLADEVVGPVNETQRDHLSRIRASSEHLLMLIEDILSYARIEAGREQVRVEEFGLAALLEQAAAIVRPLAEKKGLAFTLAGQESRAVMRSDPQKVRQIVINLLANAVKFTTAGFVRLSAHVEQGRVVFEVEDSGPGIAAEHAERVFDAFWQVDQGMTRRAAGTGLGLSVARQLARLLGGDVAVRSTLGQGSSFSVHLPLVALGRD